jgi:hypothetical protein
MRTSTLRPRPTPSTFDRGISSVNFRESPLYSPAFYSEWFGFFPCCPRFQTSKSNGCAPDLVENDLWLQVLFPLCFSSSEGWFCLGLDPFYLRPQPLRGAWDSGLIGLLQQADCSRRFSSTTLPLWLSHPWLVFDIVTWVLLNGWSHFL